MPGCYDNRDPKLPRSQLREIGVRLSTQIDGAAHSIPHHSTQLTYRQLQRHYLERQPEDWPLSHIDAELLFPPSAPLSGATTGYVNWFYEHKRGPASPKHLELLGTTARGCIVLRVLWRVPGSQASEVPYVSNVALCLYEHEHGRLESLRYIFRRFGDQPSNGGSGEAHLAALGARSPGGSTDGNVGAWNAGVSGGAGDEDRTHGGIHDPGGVSGRDASHCEDQRLS
ncbi:hypothetical protein N7468_003562 [Penicillium chermesinum]|uniref:Uncharacterized protein n=1 Tax=Penicillium chermesinum TaxID=63820 RepID=A0A9W9TSD4_9EURO|nr:uncharacterized protein N7468_003562 [Penicillium chermesinum]KAJ5238943.1 hypothetical protein N7468_003562 [Penicillium chermesinum]